MKWNLRLFFVLIACIIAGWILNRRLAYKQIELGGNIAGVRYNEGVGFYPEVLLEGIHVIPKDDTVMIYDLAPTIMDDYIEARFNDGSVARVYFKVKLKIDTDSLSKLHSNYGELYTKRFLEPTTYYTIRKFTEGIPQVDSLLEAGMPGRLEQSEIASYFSFDTLAFSLNKIN